MQEEKANKNDVKSSELSDDDIKKVSGGEDIDSLKVSGKEVPLPEAKSKKEEDGGYAGKIKPNPTN